MPSIIALAPSAPASRIARGPPPSSAPTLVSRVEPFRLRPPRTFRRTRGGELWKFTLNSSAESDYL
jgi:hypothetical protein